MRLILSAFSALLLVAFIASCSPKNSIMGPTPAPSQMRSGDRPSSAPYYEPTYIGEPCRGTCPDLGPTG